jgi:hypothetical protein
MKRAILQIVPRAPGNREGVGDYASMLANALERAHGYSSAFVTAAILADESWQPPPASAVILHYVNYGYHARGVPAWLPQKLDSIQKCNGARLLTIFHELYASGSWKQSAFWLRPLQKRIARAIARRSAVCIVSSATLAGQLHELAPVARVIVRPVPSTFGEPILSRNVIAQKDCHRWGICGGSELIERSLRSFLDRRHLLAEDFAPRELFVIGGADRDAIRETLQRTSGIVSHYLPNVERTLASEALASCAFGWLDYFEHPNVPTAAILKSTSFAAYCAHGIIPVFPSAGSEIDLQGDALPGPFYVGEGGSHFPVAAERANAAIESYHWYRRNASVERLADEVASALAP